MKSRRRGSRSFIPWLLLFPILILSTNTAFAGSTGTANLIRQFGSGYSSAGGDYISASIANGGLNQPYYYYIEVPAGLNRLRVSIYDADVGRGTANDWLSGTWNTSCTYTLYDPSGTNRGSITGSATQGTNAGWQNIINTTTNLVAGHWQLVVNMTSTVTTGDDLNGYGIRADNGDGTSGGTELNVYAESFIPIGRVGTDSFTNTFYPYVKSGCTVDFNDWDGDNLSVHTYRSRTGENTGSFNGSGATAWLNTPITNYETDLVNNDLGIWTWTGTYTDTGAGGNFGVFYAGAYNAANPPPTSQPQADTFRIYLPRDGNVANIPSKPYVTQKISFVSGPNPPSNGSTTRVRVEIAVINPAAQAITFSSSNLVSATVPGSGVVYAGNATVSQGSVTGQPGIGSAGTITWNPGSVAAGATATLYYQVDVTPTAAGQRLPVTGTPASGGTTATYVDTTGNTTQTRATYTFGPLCGLAATEAGDPIPTWVAVSCFEACASEGQPTVEWHTATETGAAGFNLWRQDKETKEYILVNRNLLPALPNSPQGGVYRFADAGAFSGEPVLYKLEEIDAKGRSFMYGPFTVVFGASSWEDAVNPEMMAGREEPTDIYGYRRFGRARTPYEQERLSARRQELQRGAALAAAQGNERVRVTVKGRGLFYVSSAQVAGSLGLAEPAASALISGYGLNLTGMGKEIAWLADANGAGIFFYNEGQESAYSDRNVYWLDRGRGRAMETVSGGGAGPAGPGQSYRDTLHFEENRYPLTGLFSDPQADLWLWDYVIGGGGAKSFPIQVPGVAGAGMATLTIALQGATDTAASQDHHAFVMLNGTQVGDASWNGTEAHVFQATFSSALLSEGGNTISISGSLDTGAPHSMFYVESFDLEYQRLYKAVANSLVCRGDGNSVVTVSGFTEAQIVALDVSNPERPKQLTGITPDLSGDVTFVPYAAGNTYLVSGLNAALRPLAVVGDLPAHLSKAAHAIEYIVIAPEEFAAAAQELADFRQGRGLKALVVTLEDIYEAFNYGVPSPLAVRDFLAFAYANGRKVKYAVLAGKGTFDYRDCLGLGDNLFPVILARTPQGLFAADKMFGDVAGRDGLPEIAVGRLPAVTAAELQAMIAKIKAYEGGQGEWTGKALFIADNADDGGDFAGSSDGLASLAAGLQAEKIYLAGPAAETRSRINAAWNAGAALVNYCGHAGLNQLATENIFNVADARALQNGGRLPLAVMLTCVAGRFELPGYMSLGEALMLNQNGGIASGLMPGGIAMNGQMVRLGEAFYKSAFRASGISAGQALLEALKTFLRQGGASYMLNAFNWLGDPALTFK